MADIFTSEERTLLGLGPPIVLLPLSPEAEARHQADLKVLREQLHKLDLARANSAAQAHLYVVD